MTDTEKFIRNELKVDIDSTIRDKMGNHGIQNASLEAQLKDLILSLVSKTFEHIRRHNTAKKEETNVNSKLPKS